VLTLYVYLTVVITSSIANL